MKRIDPDDEDEAAWKKWFKARRVELMPVELGVSKSS